MSRGRRLGSVVIVLSVVVAFDFGVGRCETGIKTLRGIDRINIVIEDLTSDARNGGITESDLQAQAELALRQIGINVTDSDSGAAKSSFVPILYLSLSAERVDNFQTFLIRMEFLQAVSLARDPTIKASSVTTWSTFRFGTVDEHSYANKIRAVLTIMLQTFQDDFLSMNPAVWPLRDQPGIKGSSVSQ